MDESMQGRIRNTGHECESAVEIEAIGPWEFKDNGLADVSVTCFVNNGLLAFVELLIESITRDRVSSHLNDVFGQILEDQILIGLDAQISSRVAGIGI
jgi:hypothetical protein